MHEQRATCQACNRKKGGKMPDVMNFRTYRPGQYSSHLVICERIRNDEPYTAIVLPTRYGKSNVIRGTAIDLYQHGDIACALVLSPAVFLRNQMVNNTKWRDFIQLHDVDMTGVQYRNLIPKYYSPTVDFTKNGEMFVSVTMSLVNTYVSFFQAWVNSVRDRTRKRVVIYIDESHTGSEDNKWGDSVKKLVDAGAQAVLLTATPVRSDGKKIPGFVFEEYEPPRDLFQYVTHKTDDPALLHVDKYAAVERKWRLVAHHTTTFGEAWGEGIIASVSRYPFDVHLYEIGLEDKDDEKALLSLLSEDKTRRYLDKLNKNRKVMRDGVTHFVEQLRAARTLSSDCAGIIFCGNDQAGQDYAANKHAEALQTLIHEHEKSWKVVIATSADPNNEADKWIAQFADEEHPIGDVLIVKQMASVGLDIARLKVILDLSSIRTEAAWIQRIMRAATRYKNIPAIYITLDDCFSRDLFLRLVIDQGGEMTHRELGELLASYTKPIEPEAEGRKGVYVAETDSADFQDTRGREGTKPYQALVTFLVTEFPHFLNGDTHAGIGERIEQHGFKVEHSSRSYDTTPLITSECETALAKAKDIANSRIRGQSYTGELYSHTIRDVWREAYSAAGIQPGLELGEIQDLEALKRLNVVLIRMELREGGYRARA
jgi:superfamily II DNA or RNA helicase